PTPGFRDGGLNAESEWPLHPDDQQRLQDQRIVVLQPRQDHLPRGRPSTDSRLYRTTRDIQVVLREQEAHLDSRKRSLPSSKPGPPDRAIQATVMTHGSQPRYDTESGAPRPRAGSRNATENVPGSASPTPRTQH